MGDTSNQNVVIIIDETDVPDTVNTLSSFTSINMVTGITAGDFRIVPAAMISDNFEIRYELGHLKILPTPLTVQAKDTFSFHGDPLPAFTSTITGLKNEDTIVSGPTYTLNPVCYGNAGTYTIIPSNVVLDCPECYTITYQSGTLYVNPKGKHAENLKPYLVCVDTLINDPTGLKYIATFGCKNENATVLYVPNGPNNYLSGAAAATAVGNVAEYFQPGGSNKFQVKFNGQKLTWTVKSYCGYQYVAASDEACSKSPRCRQCKSPTAGITASASSLSAGATKATAITAMATTTTVAPNPTTGRFVITTNKGVIAYKDLYITDVAGKIYVPKINKRSSGSLEIELPASASSGVYFVRVKIDNDYKIFRVVKM